MCNPEHLTADTPAGKSSPRERIRRLRTSMAADTIGAIVFLLALFGLIVCLLGYASFSASYKSEYDSTTYHMADTASAVVNGDHLDDYLAGKLTEEYQRTRQTLDIICRRLNVSLIYVIQVDQSDYGRFVSIVNPVNNAVDNTSYTEWELGHRRDTTNDEYRQKYRAIYEQESPFETVYRLRTTDGQHPHITAMVPIKNSGGDVAAILCMQRPIREIQEASLPYLANVAFFTTLLALFASVFAANYIGSHLVAPIRKVSDEAARFAKENTKGEPLGQISRYQELSNLAASIDTMETDMVRYIEEKTRATVERERFGTEMHFAAKIQEDSIPSDFPAFPDRTEFDIYASMDPARDVGGDFYNFFLMDDDHLAIVIGDVSGKGVPGALFMMVTNILICDRTRPGSSPAGILAEINNLLCTWSKTEMFVTVWLAYLEISTGTLTAASAGHEYPALRRAGGNFELFKDKHGFVIAGMEDMRYRDYELKLSPGDKIFVYTDGVPEATDAENVMFGTEGMLTALNTDPESSPERILKNVRLAVDEFVKDAEPFDDLTMLCLEYRG